MKKNKKNAADKKAPKRDPPPVPEGEVYEAIDPEATYDDFQETQSDDESIYHAPNDEEESAPPTPVRPQRLKKDPIPTPTEDEAVYEAAEEDESDESNKDTASGESYKPPLPPPPRGKKDKEEKKTKAKLQGHGLSLTTIQGARLNLKPTKPVEKQKSEEEPEPLSPKILKPVKNSKIKDLKPDSPTSKPELPQRPLPEPPSPQSDVNTNGTSAGSDTSDSQTDNRLKTPPLPLRRKTEEDEEEEDIYVGAVSDRLTLFEWFHGDISREEGNRRVQAVGKDGTFLIRTSAKTDVQPYTMVLLFQGRVNNLKIRIRNDGRFALGEEKTNEVHFEDVQSMVDFHKKNTVNLTGNNKGETTLKESPSLKT